MNLGSRRVKHLPGVMVQLITDVVAVAFACATALISRGWDGAVDDLTPPLTSDLWLIALSSVLGWLGLQANIRGYQKASVAAVATIAGSSSIPANYAFQVLVFHQLPDALSTAGASLVLATTIGLTMYKYFAAKR